MNTVITPNFATIINLMIVDSLVGRIIRALGNVVGKAEVVWRFVEDNLIKFGAFSDIFSDMSDIFSSSSGRIASTNCWSPLPAWLAGMNPPTRT